MSGASFHGRAISNSNPVRKMLSSDPSRDQSNALLDARTSGLSRLRMRIVVPAKPQRLAKILNGFSIGRGISTIGRTISTITSMCAR